jgi:PTS system nitrogen regulatory IIA component
MDLFMRECARLIELPESDVRRLVRQDALPAYRLHDRHRIGRVDLLEWGIARRHRISPLLFPSSAETSEDGLRRALEAGGIGPLAPGGWEAALGSVPGLPADVRPALLARLGRAFVALSDGIAIPRPRSPLVGAVDAPRLVGGYLDPPLELPGAGPARPVWLVFILVCPAVRLHLEILARLAFALHDDATAALLCARSPAGPICEQLSYVERAALLTGRHSVVP